MWIFINMKFQEYIEKVQADAAYKTFMKEHGDAYLCAAFFVRDYKENHNESSVDFFTPKEKKVMTFSFSKDKTIQARPLDMLKQGEAKIPKALSGNVALDIDQLKGLIVDEMHNRTITGDVDKLISILHNPDGKLIWHCTAFLSGMAIVKADIEDTSKSVVFMERLSFLDLLKPMKQLIANVQNMDPKELKKKGKKAKVITMQDLQKQQKPEQDSEKAEGDHEGFIG